MTYAIESAEAAENDVREAFLYYENQMENLGSLFEDIVSKAIDSIHGNRSKLKSCTVIHESFSRRNSPTAFIFK